MSAVIGNPVYSISEAVLVGTARATATPGVEQNNPRETPGVENKDLELAKTISHMATSWQPAAAATPSTLHHKKWIN